ncbi:MAG: M1 family metallopeptidase [Bacteroidota bacterium]
MNKFFLLLCILCLRGEMAGQSNYFQQEVNYTIDVTLDDVEQVLRGQLEIEYINHSPDDLQEIYFHLWGNAYKNRKTAFAKQQIRLGATEFYFAKDSDFGQFSELSFQVDGKAAQLNMDAKNPDIAILPLHQKLRSGAKITITSPFTLKIPRSFSRLGHEGQSYQITQWFPKPAVYDAQGWHPMPYLDMGEFYSEFGRFDVRITLPENYVVAATGVLQDESEKQFLNERVAQSTQLLSQIQEEPTDTFPASSSTLKTIHYRAEQVHDFAWFADKRFLVQKSEVELAPGQTVDTWAFFTEVEANLWAKGTDYLNRALKHYSDLVGTYPYPHATAVQGALQAGGGMEYPMITVIGETITAKNLDGLIAHEVGHNWFYGILAFDEREHPWMDEGFNSYYDQRYLKAHYDQPRYFIVPPYLMKDTPIDIGELGYLYQARRRLDQAPATTSDGFTRTNFVLGAYEKPAAALFALEDYLGTEQFDGMMKDFYQKWQFKHPQPADFRTHVQQYTGKELAWFFEGLIGSNRQTDYAVTGVQEEANYQLEVKNKGQLAVPFSISGMKDGQVVHRQKYEGFVGSQTLNFDRGDYDWIIIDAQHITLDINRKNNNIKTRGLFQKMEPLRLKFLTRVEHPRKTSLYWLPALARNNYDGSQLGLVLHNISIPKKGFEFSLAPMYALSSKDLVGLGNFRYHWFSANKFLKRVTFDLGFKRFNRLYNERDDYHLSYARMVPKLSFELSKSVASTQKQTIELRTIFLREELAQFSQDSINFGDYTGNTSEGSTIYELSYQLENNRALNPYRLRLALEHQSYQNIKGDQSYWKASLDWEGGYTYQVNRSVDFRIFAGGFLKNTERSAGNVSNRSQRGSFSLTSEGFNDYKYDELFLGRTENTGFLSQQISGNDGFLKNALGSGQASNLGNSNSFIVAINLKADLPQALPANIPLKPYFDIAYYDNAQPIGSEDTFSDQLVWSGGVMLDFFESRVGIYFPIVHSNNLKQLYDQRGNFFTRITYQLDFNRSNPLELMNDLKL